MAFAPLSAKNAKVRVAGSILYAASWDVEPESTLIPSTTFEDDGYEVDIFGLSKCMVRIEGLWNAAANIHDAPLALRDGVVLLDVRLYVNDTDGPYWALPFVNVQGVPVSARVEGGVQYRFAGKAKGLFAYPEGTAV